MVLLPYWLNLDSLSLIRLATLILALAIFVYLLTLKNKSPSTVFLAFVFCGGLIFNAASLLEFAGAYYWRPRTLKNIVVPLLLDAGPSLALVALLLFAYHFPRFRSEEKKEFRIVLFISLFANTARLAFAGYDFLVLQRESRDFLLTEVYYISFYCALGLQFLFVLFVLFRKTARLSGGKSHAALARILKPRGKDAEAARALGLILLLPLAAVAASLGMTYGVLPYSVATDITWFGLLLFYFAFVVSYLNHTVDPMTFQVKLVGLTLVTVLGILSLVAILAGKATESDYRSTLSVSGRRTIHFSLNRSSSYDIRETAFSFDPGLGRKLEIASGERQRVALDFDFPFFGAFYGSVHVLNGPLVYLGDNVAENGWGGYNPQPAIAPIIMNLDPTRGGGVFVKSGWEAATVTWYELPELGFDNSNTIQLVLSRDGSFDISFDTLTPLCRYESEQLYNDKTAGTKGGDPTPGSKPAPFGPRLTGIHPGGPEAPLEPVSFSGGLPLSSQRPAVIFESYEAGYYRYLHGRMAILALIMMGASVFVLFVFPALFRTNLIRPLHALYEGMRRAEAGDLGVVVSAQFHDEIGFLARSFNRMLESINRVESSFRILAENAEDGILILSGGAVVYANRRAGEMTGYGIPELQGTGFDSLVQSAALPPFGVQEERGSEALLATKGGNELPVELTFSRTQWHGKPADVVLIRDLTTRMRAEEAARLQQQRLMRTDKLMSLGVLAAGMAHEINVPNQVILSYASLLSRASPQVLALIDPLIAENSRFVFAGLDVAEFRARYPEMLSAIARSSSRIDGIIRNLKDFSRDAPGRDMGSTDVNAVVKTAVDLVSGYIKRATVCFALDLEDGLPRVRGNPQRLEQVLVNLLLNACQALTNRDQAITVHSRGGDGSRTVRIEVRDQGAGISPEHLTRMHEPFFTTKKASGGTGLGLYVSEAIVAEHKGSLSFTSEPGRGTTAVVTLPAEEET